MQNEVKSAVQLYKILMKIVRQLPKESQKYYYNSIRQHYKNHADETDVDRIKQIIDRARLDADWIAQKYAIKKEGSTSSH